MKVKHVLMIAAVLLAMLVMPVAGTDSTLTYDAGDITYTVVIPPAIDFNEGATISVSDVMLEHSTCLNITVASSGNWHLKPENGANAAYKYKMLVDGADLSSDNLVISIPDSLTEKSAGLTFDNIDPINRAGKFTDTLTFTIRITAGEGVTTQYVDSTEEAQAAIDNAVPGTTIRLQPGVNYGTLVFGKNAQNQVVDVSDIGGDATGNERYSKYKDITIIGADGATVEQITFDIGQDDDGDTIWNYIDVKNLVIKDVTFTGTKTAVMIPDGFNGMGIDGLSIVNCEMTDSDGADRFVYQPHTGYKPLEDKTTSNYVMTAGVKDLTITGCKVTGAHQVIETRPMEGITITDNTFKNSALHDILLAGSGAYYDRIIISGNSADSSGDRFVRATSIGGTVTITGNTITNYLGEDNDYIKVDGISSGTVTISGNNADAAGDRTLTTTPDQS